MDSNHRHFVGIDLATVEHEVHAMKAEDKRVSACSFKHGDAGPAAPCTRLSNATIALTIEMPHGEVVKTVLDRGFVVISINPQQPDRIRDRFTVSAAKDDRRDAMVLADSLRTDGHLFWRLTAPPAKSSTCASGRKCTTYCRKPATQSKTRCARSSQPTSQPSSLRPESQEKTGLRAESN